VIVGSGIDFIDNSRVERELALGAWTPEDGVFTASEIRFCNSGKKPALLFAACFAAKEATLKALGIEVTNLSHLRDVELLPEPSGSFTLKLHGHTQSVSQRLGVRHVCVTVAKAARLTGVVVVVES
jgi:holo-[acyl-carrier protein] synthase